MMRIEKLVVAGAGAALVLATLVGCGGGEKKSAPPTPSAEEQIRDVIDGQEAAAQDLDFDKLADLTCDKHKEEIRKQADDIIPPIDQFGSESDLKSSSVTDLAEALQKEFTTASAASINDLAEALVAYDEPAYEKSMRAVLKQVVKVSVDKVENIKIDGDKATADITSTQTLGDEKPETKTKENEFVKENGKWLDCEPPEK